MPEGRGRPGPGVRPRLAGISQDVAYSIEVRWDGCIVRTSTEGSRHSFILRVAIQRSRVLIKKAGE